MNRDLRTALRLLSLAAVLLVACGDDATSDPDGGAMRDAGPPDFDSGPPIDAPATLDRVTSVTDHGVTWTFTEPTIVGQFVTGDYYVVGPVTISAIDPPPSGGRNGSVLDIPADDSRTGFDDRTEAGRYDASLGVAPPIALAPGHSLASSISVVAIGEVDNWLREGSGERSTSPVASVSVLTSLAEAAPADAFRPSYGEPDGPLRRLSEIDRALLPSFAPPSPIDDAYLTDYADRFGRPWIDNLFFGFDAQVSYMPMYGREVARATGEASLMVMLDLPASQQASRERLLVGLVQRGIDLWGLVRSGHPGWPAFGGHGSGRKWPIVFAGLLFHDAQMSDPSGARPEARFGEDMHTAFTADLPYGPAWNGATVVYTGHQGVWGGTPVSSDPAWGPYEHLPPSEWLSDIGESYRRCCTSSAWVGEALAARLMSADATWGHDAFFAYVDRWMDPAGDAEDTQTIFDMNGSDYRSAWAMHGATWDALTGEMWAARMGGR